MAHCSKDNIREYILIHEKGWASDACGTWYSLEWTESKDGCAKQARERGLPGFSCGFGEWARGECYGEAILVTQDYFNKYAADPKDPAPTCGNKNNCPDSCVWEYNPYFNTYAINPSSTGEQAAEMQ